MAFEELKPGDQNSELPLVSVDFWIHVLDLPFGWATHAVGEAFGHSLGKMKGVLPEGNFLQLCVAWDILKPLRRSISTIKNDTPYSLLSSKRNYLIFVISVEC